MLLVHGFMGNANQFRVLATHLALAGVPEVFFTQYASSATFEVIVDQIGLEASRIASQHGALDIVAHSLGALATQAWIKACGGARITRRFVSIGGPHHGTWWHPFVRSPIGRALNPSGPWIRRLEGPGEPVPTTVIRSVWDHQVLPHGRAHLDGATEVLVNDAGHTGMLWSAQVARAVTDALLAPDVP